MYRQNSEYYIPVGTEPELAKMIRHQRYINALEHYYTVPYYDNLLVPEVPPDVQRIALQMALKRMRLSYPEEYAILINYYFGKFSSVKSFAKKHGVSQQAMAIKIKKYLCFLRILAYDELNKTAS